VTCSLCGKPIEDTTALSQIAKQVVGWNIPRKAGGQNTLALRHETGAVAHVMCVRYPDSGQGQLWSE
jgi:hypothetical protein